MARGSARIEARRTSEESSDEDAEPEEEDLFGEDDADDDDEAGAEDGAGGDGGDGGDDDGEDEPEEEGVEDGDDSDEGDAFGACLRRLTFTADTVEYLADKEGIESLEDLVDTPLSGLLEHMVLVQKNYNTTSRTRRGVNVDIEFSARAIRNLRALRGWMDYRLMRGERLDPNAFTESLLKKWRTRLAKLDRLAKRKDVAGPPEPKPFLKADKWWEWSESFRTYLSAQRTVESAIPLSYIIRPHYAPTRKMRETRYDTIDEDLENTARFSGDDWLEEDERVWQKLQPLLIDGPGWAFVRSMVKQKNTGRGRRAWLETQKQMEGPSAIQARKTEAYGVINTTKYHGGKSRYTMKDYILAHQNAYNIIEADGVTVEESKKVSDFLEGILDNDLTSAKNTIISQGDQYLEDFGACHQFISQVVNHLTAQKKAERPRNVSRVNQGDPDDKAAERKRRAAKKRKTDGQKPVLTVVDRQYSPAEYDLLTTEQRNELRDLRKSKKAKIAKKKKKDSDERQVASVSSVDRSVARMPEPDPDSDDLSVDPVTAQLRDSHFSSDEDPSDEEETPAKAMEAGQFGRYAHGFSKSGFDSHGNNQMDPAPTKVARFAGPPKSVVKSVLKSPMSAQKKKSPTKAQSMKDGKPKAKSPPKQPTKGTDRLESDDEEE